MTKLMLTKKAEISVTEEKKGKQIAVKENNIASLKQFYKSNYIAPITPPPMPQVPPVNPIPAEPIPIVSPQPTPQIINTMEQTPVTPIATPVVENLGISPLGENMTAPNVTPIMNQTIENPIVPSSIEPQPTTINPSVPSPEPLQVVTPSIQNINPPIQNLEDTTTDGTAQAINLVPEVNLTQQEEMDPELKEIKDRLDQIINDLNNYKKKIKILENEVNQNLEKSREVLKDTQAAAKIMAIQQERQRQITEEVNGGVPVNDPSRILQKDAA